MLELLSIHGNSFLIEESLSLREKVASGGSTINALSARLVREATC